MGNKNLIVVATHLEWEGIYSGNNLPPNWDLLITGIGMVNTTFQLGRHLALNKYQHIWNLGIAGAFDRDLPLGSLAEVRIDCFPELGCLTDSGWLNLQDLGFSLMNEQGKQIYNFLPNPTPSKTGLISVTGLTINTITGTESRKTELLSRFQADIETMESAAVFLACLQMGVPFTCVRSISNYVESRNTANWKVAEALATLKCWLADILF